MVIMEALNIEENLDNIEVSFVDLVPKVREKKKKAMIKKTWDFGSSLMSEEMILELGHRDASLRARKDLRAVRQFLSQS